MKLRLATPTDAQQLLNIYAPYVENTAISFEYTVPTLDDFTGRIATIQEEYPYIVAEENGRVVGYAYASTFHHRVAYKHAVEVSIYVDQSYHGKGIGRALYEKLEELLLKQNVYLLYACIASPDTEDEHLTNDSECFHKRMGYKLTAKFDACGYKFNTWYSVIWMLKEISERPANPESFIPFPELKADYPISLAKTENTEEILALYRRFIGGKADWSEYYPSLETIEFDISRNSLFIMKNEFDEIIATISIDDDKEVEGLPYWSKDFTAGELSRLCVREDMSNKGIAKKMMLAAFEELRQRGFQGVHILVKEGHNVALKAYAPLGFKQVGECDLFEKHFVCLEMKF